MLGSRSSVVSTDSTTTATLAPMLVLMNGKSEKENDRIEKTDVNNDRTLSDRSRETERKLSVRDLAIQPTQRVMRYVMLYRDLLDHTPQSSPSHALVESALETAQRIAKNCDRAQDNAAFIFSPSASSSTTTTPTDTVKNPLRTFMSVAIRQEN